MEYWTGGQRASAQRDCIRPLGVYNLNILGFLSAPGDRYTGQALVKGLASRALAILDVKQG